MIFNFGLLLALCCLTSEINGEINETTTQQHHEAHKESHEQLHQAHLDRHHDVHEQNVEKHHDHHHDHDHHHHDHEHHHDHGHAHLHAGEVCDHCGHAHAPDPNTLTGNFGIKEAWAAILAVGLRPCTGALIVLIFCFANGLYIAGVFSTLAMSIGTGIAVSAMAVMAGTAKTAALKFAVAQDSVATVTRWIEIAGALFIFLIGFVLFTAASGF